jgi:surface polysaccharide O-acyltransferase-like enzyme
MLAVAEPVAVPIERIGVVAAARRIDVEAIRLVAAFMVITVHATPYFATASDQLLTAANVFALTANMASRSASAMFFAVAGWVLLTRREQADEAGWLVRRMKRLLVPLLVWDFVYIGAAWLVARHMGRDIGPGLIPPDWLAAELRLVLAGPGTANHLWFMYYLVPLTLAIWLIRVAPRAVLEPQIRPVFIVAVLALMLPFGLTGMAGVDLAWGDFGWAIGYALLGYLLLSTAPPRPWISALLYLGASAGLVLATRATGYGKWDLLFPGPLIICQTVGAIGLIRSIRFPERWHGPILKAASLTFGVFLVHQLFTYFFGLTLYTWPIPHLLILSTAIVGTVVLSFGAVAAWHRVPLLRQLLG